MSKTKALQKNRMDINFEEICNHLIDAIYVTDGQGITLFVNDKYLELGDLQREDIIGQDIFKINEEGKVYTNGVLPEVLATKKTCQTIGTLLRTNKKVHITGVPVFDEKGEIKYAIAHEKDMDRLEELKHHLEALKSEYAKGNAEIEYLRQQQLANAEIVANSESMKEALTTVSAVAATDATVLITGESGTGKEVLSDVIYRSSNRKDKPFVKLNCSAIPANLLESELFGYEPGAFTGADKKGKTGLMEIANGGVILLDEIGDMPMELQTKMLRVLQNKEIVRVGGSTPVQLDIRLLAATNKDLREEIKKGTFREDLYYRLNVVPIHLAPLKERKEDILPLLDKFLDQYNARYNKNVTLSPDAMNLLIHYHWPGNIRELKNIAERIVIISRTEIIDAEAISSVLTPNETKVPPSYSGNRLKAAVEDLEKTLILRAIKKNGSKRKAAAALGVDHSTLIKKCQRYGI